MPATTLFKSQASVRSWIRAMIAQRRAHIARAINPERGPLRDTEAEEGEREAMAHLFHGAMDLFKNPHSHRNVELEAQEAFEMLVLAGHLLAIIRSAEVEIGGR